MLLVLGHVAFLLHFFVKDWQRGVKAFLFSLWFCDCAGVCVCLVCVLGGGEGQGCPSGFISVFKDHSRITHSFVQVRSRSLNNLFFVNKKKKHRKITKNKAPHQIQACTLLLLLVAFEF